MGTTLLLIALAVLPAQPAPRDQAANNPWAEPTRLILLGSPCARCHDGDRSTAQDEALAVYDLGDGPSWSDRMSDEQLEGFRGRLGPFSEEERESITRFVSCAISEECEPPVN